MRQITVAMLLAFTAAGCADELVMAPEALRFCVTCHGVELAGNKSVDAPNLSVLPAWYVERQLKAFAENRRGGLDDVHGVEMQPMAAALDASGIAAAVDFVASVPARPAPPTVDGDVIAGELLFATCAACHGEQGGGMQSLTAPVLAGQNDWYLLRQLKNYRSGIRGAREGDAPAAQMMAAMAVVNGDDDLRHIVAYINTLATP